MFDFLFKYSRTVYNQGTFVFLSPWPVWMLWAGIVVAAGVFGFLVFRKGGAANPLKSVLVTLLQTALVGLLLFMMWRPALSVSTLKPQQNIVAVVVDDSSSMATKDESGDLTRKDRAVKVLNDGLLQKLKDKFQVRVYRMSDHLGRVEGLEQLNAQAPGDAHRG